MDELSLRYASRIADAMFSSGWWLVAMGIIATFVILRFVWETYRMGTFDWMLFLRRFFMAWVIYTLFGVAKVGFYDGKIPVAVGLPLHMGDLLGRLLVVKSQAAIQALRNAQTDYLSIFNATFDDYPPAYANPMEKAFELCLGYMTEGSSSPGDDITKRWQKAVVPKWEVEANLRDFTDSTTAASLLSGTDSLVLCDNSLSMHSTVITAFAWVGIKNMLNDTNVVRNRTYIEGLTKVLFDSPDTDEESLCETFSMPRCDDAVNLYNSDSTFATKRMALDYFIGTYNDPNIFGLTIIARDGMAKFLLEKQNTTVDQILEMEGNIVTSAIAKVFRLIKTAFFLLAGQLAMEIAKSWLPAIKSFIYFIIIAFMPFIILVNLIRHKIADALLTIFKLALWVASIDFLVNIAGIYMQQIASYNALRNEMMGFYQAYGYVPVEAYFRLQASADVITFAIGMTLLLAPILTYRLISGGVDAVASSVKPMK